MRTIEISEEVFKYLDSQAIGFELSSPNAVLEKIFNLNSTINNSITENKTIKENPKVLLYWKGVGFPEGLQLRFKGRPNVIATVKDGMIVYKDFKAKSPSGLAVDIYGGTSANGWVRWDYLDSKTGRWEILDKLRTRINGTEIKEIEL